MSRIATLTATSVLGWLLAACPVPEDAPAGDAQAAVSSGLQAGSAASALPAPAAYAAGQWEAEAEADWPLDMPDLPSCAGWYYHLGAQADADRVVIADGYLVVTTNGTIEAFDLESGERRWQQSQDDVWLSGIVLADKGHVCFGDDDITTLDAAGGELRWHLDSTRPLALAETGVWTLTAGGSAGGSTVALLSWDDGEPIFEHGFDMILGAGGDPCGAGEQLAVRTADALQLLGTDGSLESIPLPRRSGSVELVIVGATVICLESMEYSLDPSAAGPEGYQLEQPGALRALDTHSGSERWSGELDFYYSGFNPALNVSERYVVVNKYPGARVYDLQTGDLLYDTPETGTMWGGQWLALAGERVLWVNDSAGSYQARLEWLDPAAGVSSSIPELSALTVKHGAASASWIFLICETYPTGHDYWGANSHLLAIELGEHGRLTAGELALINPPLQDSPLVERFMATADPLADAELLAALAAGGINEFNRLLARMDVMTAAQVRVLADLAVDTTEQQQGRGAGFPAVAALIGTLLEQRSERYTSCIIEWLEDDDLEVLSVPLVGALAACGDREAAGWLDEFYEELLSDARMPPSPPFALTELSKVGGVPFQTDQLPPGGWAEAVAAGGERYVAYVSDGLISARDIYLGVDADADGAFEEVLPTGLTDTYFVHVHPGGVPRQMAYESIALEIDGDELRITHHQPIIEQISYDSGGESESYERMTGGTLIASSLALTELRQDTDGDGLTDVAESLLLTDPALADTDGDGTADALDCTPNVNADQMGVAERGARRALAYYFSGPEQSFWWQGWNEAHPWTARYISVADGLGPVAYCGNPGGFGVCLESAAEQARYEELLQGFNGFSRAEIALLSVEEMRETMTAGAAESGLATDAEANAAMEEWMKQLCPPGTTHLMQINMSLHGAIIQLVEIEGELYPVNAVQTWIS